MVLKPEKMALNPGADSSVSACGSDGDSSIGCAVAI
jgi:hypothetical protein